MNTNKLKQLFELYQTNQITEKEYLVLVENAGLADTIMNKSEDLATDHTLHEAITFTIALIKALR